MKTACALIAALLLAGCVSQDDQLDKLETSSIRDVPTRFQHPGAKGSNKNVSRDQYWWLQLKDPVLTRLIETSLRANSDIAQAGARLKSAQARSEQAHASRFPVIGLQANATRNVQVRGERSTAPRTFNASLNLSWDPDLFGKLSSTEKVAVAELQAAGYQLGNVKLAVASEMARNYVAYCAARERMAAGKRRILESEKQVETLRARVQLGLSTKPELNRAQINTIQGVDQNSQLKLTQAQAANRMAILLDHTSWNGFEGRETCAIPTPPEIGNIGAPVELLRRRPDLLAAEARLHAAAARIGVAQAELWPVLSLSGSFTSDAVKLAQLGESIIANAVAGLTASVLDFGRRKAVVRERQADAEEAVAAYRKVLVTAFEEVANSLAAFENASSRHAALLKVLNIARAQVQSSREQLQLGTADIATTLDDIEALGQLEDQEIQLRQEVVNAWLSLHVALGGGWSS